jgi:hypothetical protein
MLNKLFGKKDKDYFLEIEEKTPVKTETETVVEETKVEETKSETAVETETKATSTKTESKPAPKAVTTTVSKSVPFDQPEWVKAIKNYSNVYASSAKGELTFSTDYLMANPPLGRRRPGPSLNQFKAMAGTMKSTMK